MANWQACKAIVLAHFPSSKFYDEPNVEKHYWKVKKSQGNLTLLVDENSNRSVLTNGKRLVANGECR